MFRELLLESTKIEGAINSYFKENYDEVSVTADIRRDDDSFKETRYNVEFDNNKLFMAVFLNSKGKTTLKVKEGKLQDEKEKLATYVVEKCKLAEKSEANKNSYFKKIDIEKLASIIELIEEDDICKSVNVDVDADDKIIYKLKGKYNDIVTVTYFKTNSSLMVQGAPLLVYNLLVSYIYEILDTKDVIKTLEENLKQNIEELTVEEQFKLYLPNSHDKHSEKLKKSLLQSVYNLNVTSQRYTCTELVFEVLRALEGHIKITFYNDYGIASPNKFGSLKMFTYDYNNHISTLNEGYRTIIKNKNDKVEYYESLYKHMVMYRNKYFHWDFPDGFGIDETNQIDDIEDAKMLIKDTLKLIDEYYV